MWNRRPRPNPPVGGSRDNDLGSRPRPDADERRLIGGMLAGDDDAFEAFFDGHFPRLYRFALARLDHDQAATEDVVQATLCRAVRKLHTFRGESGLFTWLCTICRHEISDYWALQGKHARVELAEDAPGIRAVLDSLAAGDPDDPESTCRRHEVGRLVQVVLDALPERYSNALEWKYVHGLSVNEIAGRLGVGPKAAESVMSRARDAFREGFAALTRGLAATGLGDTLE